MLSCMVQATSGIVQTSQCIDSLLATFVFRDTYALQLAPTIEIISWSADGCKEAAADLADCTPFEDGGSLVITLGYLFMAAIYWPIGNRYPCRYPCHLNTLVLTPCLSHRPRPHQGDHDGAVHGLLLHVRLNDDIRLG